jgi:hypothetical protein
MSQSDLEAIQAFAEKIALEVGTTCLPRSCERPEE